MRRLLTALALSLTVAACGAQEEAPVVDEPAAPGHVVRLAGLEYSVPLARELNPRTLPDRQIIDGRMPSGEQIFFGVFLRACNHGEDTETADPEIALETSPFDRTYEPVGLPADNPFAWDGGTLGPGACLPREGSVGDRFVEGSLVLFELPPEAFSDRPLVLRLDQDGEQRTLEMDL